MIIIGYSIADTMHGCSKMRVSFPKDKLGRTAEARKILTAWACVGKHQHPAFIKPLIYQQTHSLSPLSNKIGTRTYLTSELIRSE